MPLTNFDILRKLYLASINIKNTGKSAVNNHLYHAPDGGTEGEPQQVDVLLGDAVALVEGAELGQVGQHAVHLVHVRHHADQQLRGQTIGCPVIGWRIFCYG